MKRSVELVVVLGIVVGAVLLPASAVAQLPACTDSLSLFSPRNLRVSFEQGAVPGNRISWDDVTTEQGTCFQLLYPDGEASLDYIVLTRGFYSDVIDREFSFVVDQSTPDGAVVGDRRPIPVRMIWSNRHTGISGSLTGTLNLNNSGGIYRVTTAGGGAAIQSNQGIPAYLRDTNVVDIDAWTDGSSGRIYAAITDLPLVRSDDGGSTWVRPLLDARDPIGQEMRFVAASPANRDVVLLGTADGVFKSIDGGETFLRVGREISSGRQFVTWLRFDAVSDRLFMAVQGPGLFESTDEGETWSGVTSLRIAEPDSVNNQVCSDFPPTVQASRVNQVVTAPSDAQRLYVALDDWGVYRSSDGGNNWQNANVEMVLCPGDSSVAGDVFFEGRRVSATRLLVRSSDANWVVAATSGRGVFVTQDGGDNWNDVSSALPLPEGSCNTTGVIEVVDLVEDPSDPSRIWAATECDGLIFSLDGGFSWTRWEPTGADLFTQDLASIRAHPTLPGELLVGTENAGVYTPGTLLPLELTVTEAAPENEGLALSVEIGITTEGPVGVVDKADRFSLFAQSIQGYAVWRGRSPNPTSMQLIGLVDVTNPEFCFAAPCDAANPPRIAGCFADKRANCFSLDEATGRVQFFDSDVFNGFTYYYSVSTIDYGFTGDVSPLSLTEEMRFSPRGPTETAPQSAVFLRHRPDNFNQESFQVNVSAPSTDANIYAVPNPLRRSAGWDVGDNASIRFTNVPVNSTCEIFTLAGDLVRTLRNTTIDGSERGNIEWDLRNESGEDVASDVYIYRISGEGGREFLGRVTIIR